MIFRHLAKKKTPLNILCHLKISPFILIPTYKPFSSVEITVKITLNHGRITPPQQPSGNGSRPPTHRQLMAICLIRRGRQVPVAHYKRWLQAFREAFRASFGRPSCVKSICQMNPEVNPLASPSELLMCQQAAAAAATTRSDMSDHEEKTSPSPKKPKYAD